VQPVVGDDEDHGRGAQEEGEGVELRVRYHFGFGGRMFIFYEFARDSIEAASERQGTG